MSHSLGPLPGNSRSRSSKVPEPTGKRLRCFGRASLGRLFKRLFKKGVFRFPVRRVRSIPPVARLRSSHAALKRQPSTSLLSLAPENGHSSPQVLHCSPLPATRGKCLQFHSFDAAYVERLRAGDFGTQEHFGVYFTALIHVKLRSRLQSRDAIEDVRQETFARVYAALRDGKIQHPERLGSFVNSVCNNVLLEQYRANARHSSLDVDEPKELPVQTMDVLDILTAKETEKKVREILDQLSERERRLLRDVFLEERDKDEICREFGVDREYLRVLLHRAKQSFKLLYKKNTGDDAPECISA